MPHDFAHAPEPEWREFIIDHLERMADNQVNASLETKEALGKINGHLDILNGTVNTSKTKIAVHEDTLKWLWIIGGLVVTGIGIAMGVLWQKVF